MNILPIKFISESDQPIFGANFFNLAKLQRAGIPVPDGVVLAPPEIILATYLEHLDTSEKEVFLQRLEIIRGKLRKFPLPEEMQKVFQGRKVFLWQGQVFKNINSLWYQMLNCWLEEVGGKLWQGDFAKGAASGLRSQAVFFFRDKFTQASAFFDPDKGDVSTGPEKLQPETLAKIERLVLESNKKLVLPQVYEFLVIKREPFLSGVAPFTQTLPPSAGPEIMVPPSGQRRLVKSAVKVIFNLSDGFAIPGNVIDGVLVEGEKIEGFDETVFKLAEAALSFPGLPVIFRLPDLKDGEIGGTLRLLNQKNLLDQACKAFLFVRNKKNLLNVELGIPLVRSSDELEQIKRELTARRISRTGSLKFWQELAVPENLINLEDYLAVGFDGVILDLDRLQKHLGGYGIEEGEFYCKQVATLVKFIQPTFKALHKAKVPVLARGELCIHPEVLDCLIESGVWGIVANTEIEAESLPEHLHWSAERMVAKRFV